MNHSIHHYSNHQCSLFFAHFQNFLTQALWSIFVFLNFQSFSCFWCSTCQLGLWVHGYVHDGVGGVDDFDDEEFELESRNEEVSDETEDESSFDNDELYF